ncbi:MAG: PBS lyase HEAT-like repeat protein [Firmicutes bacterium ADurb.Bin300]|nr:MAG: PBS lyase HEAT-like repeat protein [Firmicutes bacterium ADurb.Bin300]
MFGWLKNKNPANKTDGAETEKTESAAEPSGNTDSSIESLSEAKDENETDELIERLRSLPPDRYHAEQRLNIIWKMGESKDPKYLRALIECLNDLSEPTASNEIYKVCTNASYALGQIGDKRAIAPLSAILHNRNIDYHRRSVAAKALAQIDDEDAFKAIKAVMHDPDKTVRQVVSTIIKERKTK